jgi:release factor glutamine methyltransferase
VRNSTIEAELKRARALLRTASASPRLDAELLLARVLRKDRGFLYAYPELCPGDAERTAFAGLLARRAQGEPMAYILGSREFRDLELRVTPATLIPRPETELLVEQALLRIPRQATARVADLGTGSGAVALALARERPRAWVTATDADPEALQVAAGNARRLGIANLELALGSWYEPLAGARFDLIVSNPPYIPASDPHLGRGDLRFEPRAALAAGPLGLDALTEIIAGAMAHLQPGGRLLLEHGYDQAEAVSGLLREAGFRDIEGLEDLAGQPRVALGRAEPRPGQLS